MTYKVGSSRMKNPKDYENLLRRPPLYQQAAELLRGKLRGMQPGTCLPSEKVLATQYGISITTLREAVRILAAEGLVTRKQGLGTFIAEPATHQDGWVALLIHHDISSAGTSPIYLRITQELRTKLDEYGIPSRLYVSRRAPGQEQFDFHCPEFFEDLEAGRIAGVIGVLLAAQAAWLNTLKDRGMMLLGFGQHKDYTVNGDTRLFYQEAVRELVRRGRRKLALMTWGGYSSDLSHHSELFQQVLEEEGLPIVSPWMKDDVYPALDGAGWGSLREIWSALPEKPDGLVISDDLFLGGVAAAIHEGGIAVPGQLEIAALMSSDRMTRYAFPISAWQTDAPTIARLLAEAQAKLWRGEKLDPAYIRVPSLKLPDSERPTFSSKDSPGRKPKASASKP